MDNDHRIVTRRPVWIALSELFYADLDKPDWGDAARILAQSPYTLAELERILRYEVCPVLRANLSAWAWPVDPLWERFDRVWLEAECSKRLGKTPWYTRSIPKAVQANWVLLKALVTEMRQT